MPGTSRTIIRQYPSAEERLAAPSPEIERVLLQQVVEYCADGMHPMVTRDGCLMSEEGQSLPNGDVRFLAARLPCQPFARIGPIKASLSFRRQRRCIPEGPGCGSPRILSVAEATMIGSTKQSEAGFAKAASLSPDES